MSCRGLTDCVSVTPVWAMQHVGVQQCLTPPPPRHGTSWTKTSSALPFGTHLGQAKFNEEDAEQELAGGAQPAVQQKLVWLAPAAWQLARAAAHFMTIASMCIHFSMAPVFKKSF